MLLRQTLPLILTFVNDGLPVEGRTRFQKMIFLLIEQAPSLRNAYDFAPNNYGPFSPELQSDIDDLIREDFLIGKHKTVEEGKIKYEYMITSKGASFVKKILTDKELDKKFKFSKIMELAEEIKSDVNTKSLSSLLSEIYQRYPDFARYSKYQF
jgi:uncharacterized protein YwgA